MRPTLEIARAFVLMYARDRVSLFFGFFFNALLMVLLGLSIEDRYNLQVRMGLVDHVRSEHSARLANQLTSQKSLRLERPASEAELAERVRSGELLAGLILEPAPAGSTAPFAVRVLGDPGRGVWMRMLTPGLKLALLEADPAVAARSAALEIRNESIRSRNVRYFDFIFPGVLAFSVMQLGLFGGLSLLHFKAGESLKRLRLTPVTRAEFLLGYTASRLLILAAQVLLYVALATLVFRYRPGGAVWPALLVLGLSGLLFTFMGIFVGGVFASPEAGNNLVRFVNYPAAFLCGVFFPRESLPGHLAQVALVYPLTYAVDALRAIANSGAPLRALALDLGVMAALTCLSALLAIKTFRWEEEGA